MSQINSFRSGVCGSGVCNVSQQPKVTIEDTGNKESSSAAITITGRPRAATDESLNLLETVPEVENLSITDGHHPSSLSEVEDHLQSQMATKEEPFLPVSAPITKPSYRRTKSMYGVSPNCQFGPKASLKKNDVNVLTIADPSSQRLSWYKPPLSILVVKKIYEESIVQPYCELLSWLIKERSMVVYVEAKVLSDPALTDNSEFARIREKICIFHEYEDDLTDKVDLIICLGGDGTLLYASSLFQQSIPPVMAFHLGSLGFLSPFQISNFSEKVDRILAGNVPLSLRTRLKAVICKKGSACEPTKSFKEVETKENIMVLNEVVIDRGPSPYLCNVDLYIEHKYITSVQGDGLIIATPTGSTAYAAAAGASMVHPNVPAILICPICPHSLSFRPIVVPAGVEIKVQVSPDARNNAWASFDGRSRQEMFKGDALRITTSKYPLPQICNSDQISDWFESLAGCLHWNVRKPQAAFSAAPSNDSLTSAGWESDASSVDNGGGNGNGNGGNHGNGGSYGNGAMTR